jgi:hypothetical protein
VISFDIRLHANFCNPALRYTELSNYCDNGEVLTLVDGYGNVKGDFVIHKLKQNVLQEDTQGGVLFCECAITLKEFVDPNRSVSRSIAAQQNAFALDVKSLTIAAEGPPMSANADLMSTAAQINSNATLAVKSVKNADTFGSKAVAFLKDAKMAVGSAIVAAQDFQSKVENYGSEVVNNYFGVRDAAISMQSNGALLITAIESGNIGDALASSTLFASSNAQLNIALLPVQKSYILR